MKKDITYNIKSIECKELSKLLKKNNRFELREIEVTEKTGDDTCEVCTKENEKKLYWLKGEYDNCNVIMCKECLEKLKSIANYFE